MRIFIIAVFISLTLSVFTPFTVQADDVLKNCNPNGTTAMNIGDIVACAIDPVADSDFFTFFGSDGETVMLTLTETGGGNSPAPYLELFDPNSDPVDDWYAQNTGVSRQFKLTKTGTYTVLVHEYGDNATVVYNIALQRISPSPAGASTLSYDNPIEDETISPVSDSDIFLFSGVEGDFIMLTLTETGGGNSPAPYLELFDPNSDPVDDWYAQNTGVSRQFKLTKTGTYTVLVHEYGDNATVVYNIALQRISPSPAGASTLSYDNPIEDETISPVSDSDIFLFSGVEGDFIMLTLTETGGGNSPAPYLELFDPNSDPVDDWYAQNTGVSRQFKLTKTGTYTVLVHEYGDNATVVYNIALQKIAPCPPSSMQLIYGDPIEDETISPVSDSDIFLFGGAQGDFIMLTLTETGGGNSPAPYLELFDPNSDPVDAWYAQNTGVSRQITLAKTGTYTVLVHEYGDNATVVYNLGLYCISGICPSLSPFADVPRCHWAYDYIAAIYQAGITKGCSQNPLKYCPDDHVTRAEMAAFIVRAVEGEPDANYCDTGSPFTDVSSNTWPCKYIKRLLELEITKGCGPGVYCPNDPVTRAQMAAFLIRAVEGEPPVDYCDTGLPFSDVPANTWPCKYIKRLLELEITKGCGPGIYCPDRNVTRAEMAAFLARAFLEMD